MKLKSFKFYACFAILLAFSGCYTVLKLDNSSDFRDYNYEKNKVSNLQENKQKIQKQEIVTSDTLQNQKSTVVINNYNYYSDYRDDYSIYRRYFWDYYPGYYWSGVWYDPYWRNWYWFDWYWRCRWYYPYSVVIIYNSYYWYWDWDYPNYYRRPFYSSRSNSSLTRTRDYIDGGRVLGRDRNVSPTDISNSNEANAIKSFRVSEENNSNSTNIRSREIRTGWERENYNSIYRNDRNRESYYDQRSSTRSRDRNDEIRNNQPIYENPGRISQDQDKEIRQGKVENRSSSPNRESKDSRIRTNTDNRSSSETKSTNAIKENSSSNSGSAGSRERGNSSSGSDNPRRIR